MSGRRHAGANTSPHDAPAGSSRSDASIDCRRTSGSTHGRARTIAARASSRRPARSSQRGDSTAGTSANSSSTAGTADTPSMTRQSPCAASAWSMRYDRKMPIVIASWYAETKRPRCGAGASSAAYSGAATAATPTPKPTRRRPATSTATPGASASTAAPAAKSAPAARSALRRPRRSANSPPASDPTSAPSVTQLVTTSTSSGELELAFARLRARRR